MRVYIGATVQLVMGNCGVGIAVTAATFTVRVCVCLCFSWSVMHQYLHIHPDKPIVEESREWIDVVYRVLSIDDEWMMAHKSSWYRQLSDCRSFWSIFMATTKTKIWLLWGKCMEIHSIPSNERVNTFVGLYESFSCIEFDACKLKLEKSSR